MATELRGGPFFGTLQHCGTRAELASRHLASAPALALDWRFQNSDEWIATAPNQVWSWDITKLRGPVKWTYFNLYVLDIFSCRDN